MVPSQKRTFEFLPLSIGLETQGGVATPLVLRGTPLPAKRWETFSTATDNQESVEISLFLGESLFARNNILIGKFRLKGIPPTPRGKASIKVEFSVATDCAVTARAIFEDSGINAQDTFQPPEELSDSFIAKTLAQAESNRKEDEAALKVVEGKKRARDLIHQAEQRLAQAADAKLSNAVAALGLALGADDSEAIRVKTDALAALMPTYSFPFEDIFGTASTLPGFFSPPKRRTQASQPRNSTSRPTAVEDKITAQTQPRILGKIFGGTSYTLDPQLCFVLMPFAAKFQAVYEDHIKPTVKRAGLRCERADEVRGSGLITWDIWERISRARFLIAELTDQNPNVFYELGLAHAISKNVILITQSMEFVPFDLKTIRCITYEFTPRGTQKLEGALAETIAELMKSS